jgi:hypothetical protein
MNPNDELNQLGYASSAPDFDLAPKAEVKAQDEADLPTLEKLFKVLQARKQYYKSTDSLTLGDLSLDNQLIVNKRIQFHIEELEVLLTSTINKVKEKMNDRQQ